MVAFAGVVENGRSTAAAVAAARSCGVVDFVAKRSCCWWCCKRRVHVLTRELMDILARKRLRDGQCGDM